MQPEAMQQTKHCTYIHRGQSASYALWLGALLLTASLAGCGRSSGNAVVAASQPNNPVSADASAAELQNASMALQPPSGYGGLYVQVSGDGWPQHMMVLVTIEDEQGRSETLAASDTDATGILSTGFLFPIDQRWLASESVSVVATTADGRIETKSRFEVVDPGTPIAADASTAEASSEESTGETTALPDEQANHTLILPLITNPGAESRASNRAATNTTPHVTSNGGTQVAVDVYAGGSGLCNGEGWVTIAIYSGSGFDATRIDPGSVAVQGTSADLGYNRRSSVDFVAFQSSSKAEPAARSRQAYQWLWHVDDANGDGSIDMIMEFDVNYFGLDCNAAAVYVSGRTQDGTTFEGTSHTDLLVLERS